MRRPRSRCSRSPGRSARRPSASALSAAANAKLDTERRRRPADDCSLRPESRGSEAARDATEKRAGAVRADEKPGAGLREVELLRVPRDERRQRREEQRVDEDDRADEEEKAAHAARSDTACAKRNAPSRLRPRPTFRLTAAEATTTRRAINLRRSVLGASGTLWTDGHRSSTSWTKFGAICGNQSERISPIAVAQLVDPVDELRRRTYQPRRSRRGRGAVDDARHARRAPADSRLRRLDCPVALSLIARGLRRSTPSRLLRRRDDGDRGRLSARAARACVRSIAAGRQLKPT